MPKLADILSAGAGAALQTGLGLPPAPVPPPLPITQIDDSRVSPLWKGATFILGTILAAVILWPKPSHAKPRSRRR